MIIEVKGDILLTSAQVTAHGVGPNDDFHQGLALSLRERWPALYKDFRHYCKTYHPKAGGLWVWVNAEGHHFVNLFTQEANYDGGGKAGEGRLEYVRHALQELAALVVKENYKSLAISKLACGAGRLDWDQVFPLIQHFLGALKIPVYVYSTYASGLKAEES